MTLDDLNELPGQEQLGDVADVDDPGAPGELGESRPDDAAIRAALRERGHDPPARARLGQEWVRLYLSGERAGDDGQAVDPGEAVTAATVPGDTTRAAAPRSGTPAGERKPRKPKASGSLWDRWIGPRGDGKKGKGSGSGRGSRTAAPKHERVSLERIVTQIGEGLARAVRDVDPAVSRCLYWEADIAGLTAEDMLRGTVVDKALQPLARGELKFRKGGALVAFPVLVGLVERADAMDEPQRSIRLAVLVPMLRETAVQVVDVAGDVIERKKQREEERGPVHEQADDLIQLILYGGPAPADQTTAAPPDPGAAQDQQAAWAQATATPGGFTATGSGFMQPPPGPPPGPYAHPYAEAPRRHVIPGQLVPR